MSEMGDIWDMICQLDFFEEGGSFTAILDPPKQRRFYVIRHSAAGPDG